MNGRAGGDARSRSRPHRARQPRRFVLRRASGLPRARARAGVPVKDPTDSGAESLPVRSAHAGPPPKLTPEELEAEQG